MSRSKLAIASIVAIVGSAISVRPMQMRLPRFARGQRLGRFGSGC